MRPSGFADLLVMLLLALAAPSAPAASSGDDDAWDVIRSRLEASDVRGAAREADARFGAGGWKSREDSLRGAAGASTLGAIFLRSGGDSAWSEAERWARRSLDLRRAVLGDSDADVAAGWSELATVLDYRGRWEEALDAGHLALNIRTRRFGADDTLVADDHLLIGSLLYRLARLGPAEGELQQAWTIRSSQTPSRTSVLLEILNDLGEVQRSLGRYEQAEATYRSAVAQAGKGLAADDPLWPYLLNNLAGVLKDQERFDEAEPLLRRSLNAIRAGDRQDPLLGPTGHLNLAEVYRLQGRDDEAGPLYREALRLARHSLEPGSPLLAFFLNQMAVFEQGAGDPHAAELLFREGLAITETSLGRDHPTRAQVLLDLATLLGRNGAGAEADSLLRVAWSIRVAALGDSSPEAAAVQVQMARRIAEDPRRRDEALEGVSRALGILSRTQVFARERLLALELRSRLFASFGDFGAALDDAGAALDLVDSLRVIRGGGNDARIRLLQEHRDLFDRVIDWSAALGDTAAVFETMERSRARVLLDQIEQAGLDLYAGLDSVRSRALRQEGRAARSRLAESQRLLLEMAWNPVEDTREQSRPIVTLEHRRDSLAWAVQRVEEQVRTESPAWKRIVESSRTRAGLQAARDLAGDSTWILAYHLGQEGSHLVAIPPGGGTIMLVTLTVSPADARALAMRPGSLSSDALARVLGTVQPGSTSGGILGLLSRPPRATGGRSSRSVVPEQLVSQLRALRCVLLPDTLWAQMRSGVGVLVIPDGPLHAIPFEALVTGLDAMGLPRYWLDDGPPVAYAPSVTAIVRARARRLARRNDGRPLAVLSVVDPRFSYGLPAGPGALATRGTPAPAAGHSRHEAPVTMPASDALRDFGSWARLPHARWEAGIVASAFGPGNVLVLSDSFATEANVRREIETASVLHFATHGFLAEQRQSLLAGLALAPGQTDDDSADDGLLQAFELSDLDLNADLAILAGCVTQQGAVADVEGAFALSRSFFAAGANEVVASLWSVSDKATALLVGDFIPAVAKARQQQAGGRDAVALRNAKRVLRSHWRWAHPFYWAPFVITGMP